MAVFAILVNKPFTKYKPKHQDMENRMNYTKAILLVVSGIIAITAMLLLGRESEAYGFLLGYGYTALGSGLIAIVYTYFKNQKARQRSSV